MDSPSFLSFDRDLFDKDEKQSAWDLSPNRFLPDTSVDHSPLSDNSDDSLFLRFDALQPVALSDLSPPWADLPLPGLDLTDPLDSHLLFQLNNSAATNPTIPTGLLHPADPIDPDLLALTAAPASPLPSSPQSHRAKRHCSEMDSKDFEEEQDPSETASLPPLEMVPDAVSAQPWAVPVGAASNPHASVPINDQMVVHQSDATVSHITHNVQPAIVLSKEMWARACGDDNQVQDRRSSKSRMGVFISVNNMEYRLAICWNNGQKSEQKCGAAVIVLPELGADGSQIQLIVKSCVRNRALWTADPVLSKQYGLPTALSLCQKPGVAYGLWLMNVPPGTQVDIRIGVVPTSRVTGKKVLRAV